MNYKNIILDTDPGVDDAVAMFFLSQTKNIKIKLIVASLGNKTVESVVQNCLYLKNRFNIKAPVVMGAKKPIARELKDASAVHGILGLGDLEYKPIKEKVEENYCEKIKDIVDANKEVIYIALGPLTNLAMFLRKYPTYKTKFKKIIFMGGVKDKVIKGNVYPEFNVGVDPEAVEEVINKGTFLTIVPSELGHFTYFDEKDVERIAKTNKMGLEFSKMFKGYFDRCVPKNCVATHDACVAMYAINNKFFKEVKAKIKVGYFDEIKTGALVNEIVNIKNPNSKLVVDVNNDKFKEMFFLFLKNFE